MKKLAVVHYMPLEFYPPVINFLNILSSSNELDIEVFSTENNREREIFSNKNISRIWRVPLPDNGKKSYIRFLRYIQFNIVCFLRLLIFNPQEVIYFESYSAGPVFWYLKFYGKNKKLKIHCHEYFSPQWYDKGMRLVRIYHTYEKKFLYEKAEWISHTNQERINLFLKDHLSVDHQKMQILPNYPPKAWSKTKTDHQEPVNFTKIVYVGSLSIEATYIKEFCEWVAQQNGRVKFDIYSYNLHHNTEDYLNNLDSDYINFIQGGVEYDKLPFILNKYDVGVILYKALSENFIYNAPNKLFEYMACGLEVWFSDKMKGCYPYQTTCTPRILAVNFLDLNTDRLLLNMKRSKSTNGSPLQFTAEQALIPLIKKIRSYK